MKKLIKNISICLIAVSILIQPICGMTAHASAAKSNPSVNGLGNINNGGLAVQDGDWIYYSSITTLNKLYKVNIKNSKKVLLCKDNSSYINVSKGWIYYSNASDGGKIYKIRTDGTKKTKVNNDDSTYIVVSGDWIYYVLVNKSDYFERGKIYKIKTNGTGKMLLSNNLASCLNVLGNSIYYINQGSEICKITVNGTGRNVINKSGYIDELVVDKNYIYSMGQYTPMYKMRMDGTDKIKLIDCKGQTFNICNGWIYYTQQFDESQVYRVSLDGKGKTEVGNIIGAGRINIAGEWIFYSDCNGAYRLSKIKAAGTEKTFYDEYTVFLLGEDKDWIYYEVPGETWEYKRMKWDGSERTVLLTFKETEYYIGRTDDGWIYYGSYDRGPNGEEENSAIYKIKQDGTGKTKLFDAPETIEDPLLAGYCIFYTGKDGTYKFNIDNSVKIKISYDKSINKYILNDWLFYCNPNDNNKIYKMKTDGTQQTKLCDETGYRLRVSNDWLYYSTNNSTLYRVDLTGNHRKKLCEYYDTTGYGDFELIGDWIYYSDYNNLCRVKIDGSSKTKLLSFSGMLHVEGILTAYKDSLFFITSGYEQKGHRIKVDGTKWEDI